MLELSSMKSDLLRSVTNNLLTNFYTFSFSILPDELQAEQLIIDSYSVFLVRHKEFIDSIDVAAFKKNNNYKLKVRKNFLQNA